MSYHGKIIALALSLASQVSFLFSQVTAPDSSVSLHRSDSVTKNEAVAVNEISIIGNKVTKRHIIQREMPFREGDSIVKNEIGEKLKSARQNLLNTSLFNFVTVDTLPAGTNRVNVLVTVAERWYTWPVPIFEIQERNFNEWWIDKDLEKANYGFFLNRENFRGRKEDLSFYAQFGYTEKFGLSYKVPYLTKKQKQGAGFSFSYSRNHEISYSSVNNHQLYYKDPDKYLRQEFSGKLHTTFRKGIHHSHYFETRFTRALVDDTILFLTVDYFAKNLTEMNYFSLDYSFRRDYRDSKAYPLQGHFLELEANKLGLGILNSEKLDVMNFYLTLRKYEKLSNRFYLAGGLKIKYSANTDQPYFVQKGLGWRDFVRGYEYYVIDGQRYGTAKLGLRYEIVKPHVQKIPIPLSKFNTFHYALYFGIYGDLGYVDDHLYAGQNSLANTMLYGYGAGIDYVTYYDVVFRIEYSMNKMLEHGLFIHFNSGI